MRTRFSILSRRSIRDGHGKRRGGAPPWSETAGSVQRPGQPAPRPSRPFAVHASDDGHPTSLPMRSSVAPDTQRAGHGSATTLLRPEGLAVAPEERGLGKRGEGAAALAEADRDRLGGRDLSEAMSVDENRGGDVGCSVADLEIEPSRDNHGPRMQ